MPYSYFNASFSPPYNDKVRKKGLSIIRQVADQCDEILSKDYKDAISDV